MIRITATGLKTNFRKHLALVWREDILVTKHGKDIAILVAPQAAIRSMADKKQITQKA